MSTALVLATAIISSAVQVTQDAGRRPAGHNGQAAGLGEFVPTQGSVPRCGERAPAGHGVGQALVHENADCLPHGADCEADLLDEVRDRGERFARADLPGLDALARSSAASWWRCAAPTFPAAAAR
jgi:hypothetical protein